MKPEETKEIWSCSCPKGHVFKDADGNIINTTKIVLEKKKREYPKSLAECLEVLGYAEDALLSNEKNLYSYNVHSLADFQKILICRDAYWKIAGEEMGLRKSWEPDWENSEEKRYCIVNIEGSINLPEKTLTKWILKVTNKILVFPTEEMRDAFYDNFEDGIERCKELL